MSFLTTCSDQLRKQISAVTKLSLRDVEKFHEQRSDLVVGLTQIADMLEGNFTVEEEVKPATKQVQKPQASLILSEKGNLVRVDFRKRKVLVSGSDNPPPKRRR